MTGLGWVVAAGPAIVVGAAVTVVLWRRRVRARRPLTVEEKLLAARKASAKIRRSSPRGTRLDRVGPGGERYSAAILENSVYGDLAGGGSDSGGGGGGGSD